MTFLRKFFRTPEKPVQSDVDFWIWFSEHEKEFRHVIKTGGNIERDFFDRISAKLDQLRPGFWFLAGMLDDKTAELVLTADGVVKNIVFVEDLVAKAPSLPGWKFTALKAPLGIKDVNIRMADFEFSADNLWFYQNENPAYPDEIDITVVHDAYTPENNNEVSNGIYIFLDNFLGELQVVNLIDNLSVSGRIKEIPAELVPIGKLKDFLVWREKEFVEKYTDTGYDDSNDRWSALEATLTNGKPLLAVANSTLLGWDSKASHPWITAVTVKYEGNDHGLPDHDTYAVMDELEDTLLRQLSGHALYAGRETADGLREIFFVSRDFRWPARIVDSWKRSYASKLEIEFDIYKDKYWKSLNRFDVN